jgi:hypothetical protein
LIWTSYMAVVHLIDWLSLIWTSDIVVNHLISDWLS